MHPSQRHGGGPAHTKVVERGSSPAGPANAKEGVMRRSKKSHSQATIEFRPPVPGKRGVLVFLFLWLGGLALAPTTRKAEAGTVTTGPAPTDTVVQPDGSAAYVLNSGNSTLTVVDPATNTAVSTILLPAAFNTCLFRTVRLTETWLRRSA